MRMSWHSGGDLIAFSWRMRAVFKFFMGVAIGVLITMAVLQVWGARLQRSMFAAAQPQLLQPFAVQEAMANHHIDLPVPWLPTHERGDWSIRQFNGAKTSLDQFKGKVIVLNFWSTTCHPCIAEMPALKKLADSMANQGVVVLAVTTDSSRQVSEFLQQNSIGIPVYLAGSDVPKDFAVVGIPTTVVLDENGTAVYRYTGPAKWDDEAVQSYLRSLAAHG